MRGSSEPSYGSIEQGAAAIERPGSCSQLESASNLIAVLTGAGMLTLPYAAGTMGWSALILLVAITLAFLYSFVLLAQSMNSVMVMQRERAKFSSPSTTIDYIVLGKEAFGKGGDFTVFCILAMELFLALVSFFINIGLNLCIVSPGFGVQNAIVASACIAMYLSLYDMKVISR